jgi:Protein of Unknown function (DUF2784)
MIQLAALIVAVHLAWILLIIFGALWTRRRPVWSTIHVVALVWGIIAEVGPWPCPLTVAEEYFEVRAGAAAYHGSFALHYLEAIVYPNLPGWIVAGAGVAVCAVNLGVYGWRAYRKYKSE